MTNALNTTSQNEFTLAIYDEAVIIPESLWLRLSGNDKSAEHSICNGDILRIKLAEKFKRECEFIKLRIKPA